MPFLLVLGAAIRHCDEEKGWLEPDLFNCTSPAFKELSMLVIPSALQPCQGRSHTNKGSQLGFKELSSH